MSADGLLCAKQAPVNPLLDASHHRKYLHQSSPQIPATRNLSPESWHQLPDHPFPVIIVGILIAISHSDVHRENLYLLSPGG